jgi:hypothetical protein
VHVPYLWWVGHVHQPLYLTGVADTHCSRQPLLLLLPLLVSVLSLVLLVLLLLFGIQEAVTGVII